MEPYAKAHKLEITENDSLMYMWFGKYGLSAVSVAVEHCIAGQKASSKYIDKPIMQEIKQEKIENQRNVEAIAVFEMKKRTHMLEMQGLPQSPT